MLKTNLYYKLAAGAILAALIWLSWSPIFAGKVVIHPILLDLGAFQLHWYGLTMALAIAAAYLTVLKSALPVQKTITVDQFTEASLWMTVGGLVGARLLFVVLKWPDYAADLATIFRIDQGGMSLHGALLGGLLGLIWYGWRQRANWVNIADLVVIGLPIGQIVGRLGNFINQEAYGGPTDLPWKMFVRPENRPELYADTSFFHPTFLYESLLVLLLYAGLRLLLGRAHKPGALLAAYLVGYSIVRFGIEFFRIDSDRLGLLSIAQWASLAIVALGIIWYYRSKPQGKTL